MIALQAALVLLLGVALAPSFSEQASVASGASGASGASVEGQQPHAHPLPGHIAEARASMRRLRHIPPPPPPKNGRTLRAENIKELTMVQILDHYNPTDKRTWKQRFFARDDLYEDGGPAFIYIGGEGAESASSLQDYALYMTFMADILKAKTFDLEHRFYGNSHPLPDLSADSLQYLSADQALADLAYFIEYLKKNGDIEEGQKIAVFGGSYPGNLAAWARYKYPHLVQAAVSSSAPVHAKADFFEYMEVVGCSITKVAGKFCYDNLKKATDRVVQLLKTTDGYTQVQNTFHVATPLKDKLDLDAFFENLGGPFALAVQYNRESKSQPQYSIKSVCSSMSGDNLTPDEAMTKLAALVLAKDLIPGKFYDWSYKSSIKGFQNTEYVWDPEYNEYKADRQWIYQTCSEFGYFQTYSADDVPFPNGYNDLEYDFQMCKDVFGAGYDMAVVNSAVERTNLVFGDRKPDVTNVIFVNGDVDPWHALGIVSDVSNKAPAFLIDEGSHCSDMYYPASGSDSASLTAAHTKIHLFLLDALYEEPNADPAQG